jgi:hypothetical protein
VARTCVPRVSGSLMYAFRVLYRRAFPLRPDGGLDPVVPDRMAAVAAILLRMRGSAAWEGRVSCATGGRRGHGFGVVSKAESEHHCSCEMCSGDGLDGRLPQHRGVRWRHQWLCAIVRRRGDGARAAHNR